MAAAAPAAPAPASVDAILIDIGLAQAAEARERLRARLGEMDKAWLIEELIKKALPPHAHAPPPPPAAAAAAPPPAGGGGGAAAQRANTGAMAARRADTIAMLGANVNGRSVTSGGTAVLDVASAHEAAVASGAETEAERLARAVRVRPLGIDLAFIQGFIEHNRGLTRARLIETGHLYPNTPPQGARSIVIPRYRTPLGEVKLRQTHDVLYALLYGDSDSMGVALDRTSRELMTLVLPRHKAHSVTFMLIADSEHDAVGSWKDPQHVADDSDAPNVTVEVEFGEVESKAVTLGVKTAIGILNLLEINEQLVYGRFTKVDDSTLA